jgi:hypothetical protein
VTAPLVLPSPQVLRTRLTAAPTPTAHVVAGLLRHVADHLARADAWSGTGPVVLPGVPTELVPDAPTLEEAVRRLRDAGWDLRARGDQLAQPGPWLWPRDEGASTPTPASAPVAAPTPTAPTSANVRPSVVCDHDGCPGVVAYVCVCDRCDREPDDGRFHACHEHGASSRIDEKHARVFPRHRARMARVR